VAVKRIENILDESYSRFIEGRATIFHDPAWLKQYGDAVHLYGIYTNDILVGVFYAFVQHKGPFTFYRTPPFTPHNGLFIPNQSSNPAKVLSETKRITKEVADFFNGKSLSLVSCVLPNYHIDTQPFIWNQFKTSVHYTYHADLNQSESDLENNMSTEHRNQLKKALKDGVVCSQTLDYREVESMVMKTFSRKNKELDQSRLKSILFEFATPANSFAFVARKEGKVIAATFCLFDQKNAYYLLGGYDPEDRHGGAGILCVHNAMLHAKKSGKVIFDFEGSMLPEVEKYFRAFGPKLIPYFGFHKAWLPLEFILKLIKRGTF
jgi:Acetyltransferase (GNAT) domain